MPQLGGPEPRIYYGIVQPGDMFRIGIPIIRVSDLRGDRHRCGGTSARCLLILKLRYLRDLFEGGELVMSIVGTVGQTAIIDDRFIGWIHASRCGYCRCATMSARIRCRIALRSPIVRGTHHESAEYNCTSND